MAYSITHMMTKMQVVRTSFLYFEGGYVFHKNKHSIRFFQTSVISKGNPCYFVLLTRIIVMNICSPFHPNIDIAGEWFLNYLPSRNGTSALWSLMYNPFGDELKIRKHKEVAQTAASSIQFCFGWHGLTDSECQTVRVLLLIRWHKAPSITIPVCLHH